MMGPSWPDVATNPCCCVPAPQAVLRDRHQDVLYSPEFSSTAPFDPPNRTLGDWLPVSHAFKDGVGVVASGQVRP